MAAPKTKAARTITVLPNWTYIEPQPCLDRCKCGVIVLVRVHRWCEEEWADAETGKVKTLKVGRFVPLMPPQWPVTGMDHTQQECARLQAEQPTPAPGAIPATGVAALLREPESDPLCTASIPQRGEESSAETTNASAGYQPDAEAPTLDTLS